MQTDSAKRTVATLGKHVSDLTGHLLDVSDYNAHGHAIGRQGAQGHTMPKNYAHLQDGAHIPQNMYSDMQGGSAADDPVTDEDYGTVDKNSF